MAGHSLADIETDPAAALATLGLELPEVADDPKYTNWRVTDNGRDLGTAIGVAGLPRNSPVEVQLVCEARR